MIEHYNSCSLMCKKGDDTSTKSSRVIVIIK